MTNFNIENIAAQFGASLNKDDLRVGKKKYQPTTVAMMQEALVARLNDAINELKVFDGWDDKIKDAQFSNPTIKRVLGGLQVQLTFGSRGESIGFNPWFFAINRDDNQLEDALNCLDHLHKIAAEGAFDAKLAEKLASFQERAEKGKEARKKQAEEKRQAKLAAQSHLQVA